MLITLRNEKLNLQSGSARVYDMAGKYRSYELTYLNRDGSPGTDFNLLFLRAPRTISNGKSIELRDFSTVSNYRKWYVYNRELILASNSSCREDQ